MKALSLLLAISAAVFALLPRGRCAEPVSDRKDSEPPKKETPIAQLIQDLGSKRFVVRQDAAKQLRARAKEAVPELLRAAAESNDAEIKEEAGKLAEQILWPKDEVTAKKQLAKLPELMKNRQIDLVIETLVYWRDFADLETLKQIQNFAYSLAEEFEKETKVKLPRPKPSSVDWARGESLGPRTRGTIVLGTYFDARSQFSSVTFVSSMRMWFGDFSGSIVFCNGGTTPSGIRRSIVFVNGDLYVGNNDFPGEGEIDASLVISTGKVTTCYARASVVLALGELVNGSKNPAGSYLKPGASEHFKRIPLIDTSYLGFSLKSEKNKVVVDQLNKTEKRRSDLLPSDEIRAINGQKVDSVDSVMRLIRRSMITGTGITIATINRNKVVMFLPINCN